MTDTISAAKVEEVFLDSLFRDEEIADLEPGTAPEGAVIAEGIMITTGFHPDRLESHRTEVIDWLDLLDRNFFVESEGGGGGWSFLQLSADADGNQWGEHRNAEQLMLLGIGLGLVTVQLPRELWGALPGGVPYLAVSIEGSP